MLNNPFTPVFGGKPDFFFGRNEVISKFKQALIDKGSEARALFITGVRGSGKTALVEQLSLTAAKAKWDVIDLGPENAVHALVRRLSGHDEETKTINPKVSVNVLGSGGSLSGVATAKTTRVDESDLDLLLIEACSKAAKGVLVTIDEVQKLSEEDISAISNAFQMASRKGCEAILVVAGLPFSYNEVISYSGCTFMRRALHERISLLSRKEVEEAFRTSLVKKCGLKLEDDAFEKLVQASFGHPYMVQLLGFYLIEHINSKNLSSGAKVTKSEIHAAIDQAVEAYQTRALAPMMEELSEGERLYLQGMASVLSADRVARTADIASAIGKDSKQTSVPRDRLIKQGIVVAGERGELMFAIPYLAGYLVAEGSTQEDEAGLLKEWGV